MRQILLNLVGNAVKFAENGAVLVNVDVAGDPGDERVGIHIAVSDTGIGIPSDALVQLFQPFSQADGTMSRRFGGTGLGLSISRQLANLMGGDIGVESEEGAGSTFWFASAFDVMRTASSPLPHPAIEGRHVLLVSDRALSRQAVVEDLEGWGMQVVVAEDVRTGVAYLCGPGEHLPMVDAIVLDIDGRTGHAVDGARELAWHVRRPDRADRAARPSRGYLTAR